MNASDSGPSLGCPGGKVVRLLVDVRGLSGRVYPAGTEICVPGSGLRIEGSVDGFLHGDWIPMRWFEYSTGVTEGD